MTTEDALSDYYAKRKIRPVGTRRADWMRERWYRVGGVPGVPILPLLGGLKQTLILHDVHHMVTGYDTDWNGELELAGWELGTGGCGWSLVFWIDRLGAFLAGLAMHPRATLRAFACGLGRSNLYGRDLDHILDGEIDALRDRVGGVAGSN